MLAPPVPAIDFHLLPPKTCTSRIHVHSSPSLSDVLNGRWYRSRFRGGTCYPTNKFLQRFNECVSRPWSHFRTANYVELVCMHLVAYTNLLCSMAVLLSKFDNQYNGISENSTNYFVQMSFKKILLKIKFNTHSYVCSNVWSLFLKN